jgi:hypothetical protein
MTKKNIKYSILAALALSATSAFAAPGTPNIGELVIGSGNTVKKVSAEIFQLHGTVTLPAGEIIYKPHGIASGSVANPVFNFVFSGDVNSSINSLKVYELNTSATGCNDTNIKDGNLSGCTANGKLVGTDPQLVNDSDHPGYKKLIFSNGNERVYNDKWYIIDTDTNASNGYGDVNITMTKEGSLNVEAKLYSGDSNDLQDNTQQRKTAITVQEYSLKE